MKPVIAIQLLRLQLCVMHLSVPVVDLGKLTRWSSNNIGRQPD
jgi:hypothetical protein